MSVVKEHQYVPQSSCFCLNNHSLESCLAGVDYNIHMALEASHIACEYDDLQEYCQASDTEEECKAVPDYDSPVTSPSVLSSFPYRFQIDAS